MLNFTSMATGFQNRGDENRIERRKVAEAFEQFKQNNPEATLAQFQQYIDGMSGGRNYLAGGAGSGEALRKLASDNQAKKARRLAAEGQASMMSQFKNERFMQESLQDEINNALLNAKPTMPPKGPFDQQLGVQKRINYSQVAKEFAENNPLVGKMGIDLTDMFTSDQRGQVMSDLTDVNLPKVQAYINGLSVADLKNVELDDITRMFRMNPIVAEAVLKKAKGISAENTERAVQQLRVDASDHLIKLFKDGVIEKDNLGDHIKDRFINDPNYHAAFNSSENAMEHFTNSMQRPLERLEELQLEEKQKVTSREKAKITHSVEDGLNGLQTKIMSMLKSLPREEVRRKITQQMMSRVPDDLREEFITPFGPGDYGTSNEIYNMVMAQIDTFLTVNSVEHEDGRIAALQTVPSIVSGKASALVMSNIKKGTDTFTQNSAGASMSNGNPAGQHVVRALGGPDGFVMTPSTISIINEVLKGFMVQEENGDDYTLQKVDDVAVSLDAMTAAARAALTNNAPLMKDSLSNLAALTEAELVTPKMETFQSYLSSLETAITATNQSAIKDANDVLMSSATNPAEALKKLEAGLRNYKQRIGPHYKSMARQHAVTELAWVDPRGDARYDPKKVQAALGKLSDGSVEQAYLKMMSELQSEIRARSYDYSNPEGNMKNPTVPVPAAVVSENPKDGILSSEATDVMAEYRRQLIAQGRIPPPSNANPAEGGDPEPNPNAISAVNLKRAEDLAAKAEATGVVPPYATMADEGERRDWRNAFEKTHHRDGTKIQSFSEKANQIGSEIYNDAQSAYRYLTD